MLSAFIGATAALIVAVITQWELARRARSEFLTRKLEDLYLTLLEWMSDVNDARQYIGQVLDDKSCISPEHRSIIMREYYKPFMVRRVKMYISLYFPKLSMYNNELFSLNQSFASTVRSFGQGNKKSILDIHRENLRAPLVLKSVLDDISQNRAYLTKSSVFSRSYKQFKQDGANEQAR